MRNDLTDPRTCGLHSFSNAVASIFVRKLAPETGEKTFTPLEVVMGLPTDARQMQSRSFWNEISQFELYLLESSSKPAHFNCVSIEGAEEVCRDIYFDKVLLCNMMSESLHHKAESKHPPNQLPFHHRLSLPCFACCSSHRPHHTPNQYLQSLRTQPI